MIIFAPEMQMHPTISVTAHHRHHHPTITITCNSSVPSHCSPGVLSCPPPLLPLYLSRSGPFKVQIETCHCLYLVETQMSVRSPYFSV